MMIDGGTVMIVILIFTVIAFMKGYAYERKNRDDSPKFSERDLQRLRSLLDDLQKTQTKS